MAKITYQKFLKRWEEVTDIPPQKLGPFTPVYKTVVSRLKVMPIPGLILISIITVILIYFLIGSAITLLVSILQRGF
jgi:hypothetical protein